MFQANVWHVSPATLHAVGKTSQLPSDWTHQLKGGEGFPLRTQSWVSIRDCHVPVPPCGLGQGSSVEDDDSLPEESSLLSEDSLPDDSLPDEEDSPDELDDAPSDDDDPLEELPPEDEEEEGVEPLEELEDG